MRIFKKAILSTIAFIICFCFISAAVIMPTGASNNLKNAILLKDREEITIPQNTNWIFLGASHCANGFCPAIIDDKLEVNSYNLAVQAMKLKARYVLLENVIPKYPIDTVILEVSTDTFVMAENTYSEGNLNAIKTEKKYLSVPFIISNSLSVEHFDEIQDVYNSAMNHGFSNLLIEIQGGQARKVTDGYNTFKLQNKGYESFPTHNVELSDNEAINNFEALSLNMEPLNKNLRLLKKCVELCHNNSINVILVVTPISDSQIWQNTGWDDFRLLVSDFAKENNCELYNFDLLKDRYKRFRDNYSFYDETHLSSAGAMVLSYEFANIINDAHNGIDVSNQFYSSYDEMIKDSPYMQIYLASR